MKILKTKEDIYLILSYDNTNEMILINCLKKLKKLKELNINILDEYKYCLPNIFEINNLEGNIIKINLENEFNYKFIFDNEKDIKNKLKEVLKTLREFSNDYKIITKGFSKNLNLIYDINEEGDIIIKNNLSKLSKEEKDIFLKGKEFLNFYPIIKDFKNFINTQPYDFNNNKILYFGYIINTIYDFLIELKNDEIEIVIKYLKLIYYNDKLMLSLIEDLKNNINYEDEFFIKIKSLCLLFESNTINYLLIRDNFNSHLFEKRKLFSKDDAETFKNIRTNLDKIDKINKINNEYNIKENLLEIKIADYYIRYKYGEYSYLLSNKLQVANDLLSPSWENNSLLSFQIHNFLQENDINYLKQILKEILKSNFYKDLEEHFSNHQFYEGSLFDSDEKIDEFLDNIIFVPFYAIDLRLAGFTFFGDLKILISGYPYIFRTGLDNYKVHKILNLSFLVILLIQESIDYAKRKLYYLTCGIISRESILEGVRFEGDNILEKLLFGWEDDNNQEYYNKNKILKSKKLNLEIAFKLLNANNYKNNVQKVKDILYNNKEPEEFDDLLKQYLKENNLEDENVFKVFIEENKDITINAQRNFDEGTYIEYIPTDHRKCFSFRHDHNIK